MSTQRRLAKKLREEEGSITLDFIFALMLAFGFAVVFFSISLTLSLVEVTQYIAYATSRTYSAAHESEQSQRTLAEAKFKEIMAYPVFKQIFSLGWFVVGQPQITSFDAEFAGDAGQVDSDTFSGARIPIHARMLNLNLPFLGQTATNSTTGRANVSSYLSREVTTEECRVKFNKDRFQHILQMKDASTGTQPYASTPVNANSAVLITDNGC
jgi:hypothetical protein